jgi:hypothetical protein
LPWGAALLERRSDILCGFLERADLKAWGVIPLEFLGLVKVPIGLPITAGVKRPELQYRLGTSQAPACPRDSHPIFDQVTAGPFDDTGGDGESLGQRIVIVQHISVLEQIIRAGIDRLALIGGELT